MNRIRIEFVSNKLIKEPRVLKVIAYMVVFFFLGTMIFMTVTPWQQMSIGNGKVLAIDPNMRIQSINSSVTGRIKKWHIKEGNFVNKGDLIVELEDLDPNFLDRLMGERDTAFNKLEAIKIATQTAVLDYNRQKALFNKGLSSRIKFEKAKINYKKLLSDEATAAAKLLKIETKLSRQLTQEIRAPKDGQILKIFHGSGSVVVSEGEQLATFVPDTQQQSAEVFVSGNDLPLITPGRKVRLQFEGWPAVQVSGWPSLAIGTFGGEVFAVDPSTNKDGKVRVLIIPDKDDKFDWPSNQYLRQGTRVYAWIMLDEVKVGFEIWRKFNGFPPSMDDPVFKKLENKKNKVKKKKTYEDDE